MSYSHEFVPLKALIRDGTKTVIASQDLRDSCYKCHQLPPCWIGPFVSWHLTGNITAMQLEQENKTRQLPRLASYWLRPCFLSYMKTSALNVHFFVQLQAHRTYRDRQTDGRTDGRRDMMRPHSGGLHNNVHRWVKSRRHTNQHFWRLSMKPYIWNTMGVLDTQGRQCHWFESIVGTSLRAKRA